MSHITTPSRWARIGVGGAALAVGIGVAAGPALGALGDEGQPPPGSRAPKTTDFVPGEQPPPGSHAPKVTDFVLGSQPPNLDPQPPTRRTTEYTSDEPATHRPIQADVGAEGLPPTAE